MKSTFTKIEWILVWLIVAPLLGGGRNYAEIQGDELGLKVRPLLSLRNLSRLQLSDSWSQAEYNGGAWGSPEVGIELSVDLLRTRNVGLMHEFRMGYSYKVNASEIGLRSGGKVVTSSEMHWLNLAGGLRAEWVIPAFDFMTFSFGAGAGLNNIYRRTTYMDMVNSYAIPVWYWSPRLHFWGVTNSSDVFRGFSFGVSLYRSFLSKQDVNSWLVDVGFQWRL